MTMISENPNWHKFDASKLSDYCACPRMFFFRHILGWSPPRSPHLDFGTAWHEAMEQLLLGGYGQDNQIQAFRRFAQSFAGCEGTDKKNPQSALEAITEYCQHYATDKFEVLYTEILFSIPIDADRNLIGRSDAIIRGPNGIYCLEHKTGSNFNHQWQIQWPLSIQVLAYTHMLHCVFEPKDIFGIILNGVFFKSKSTRDYNRLPIAANIDRQSQWLFNVNRYIDQIERDLETVLKTDPEANVLEAFPQSPNSCSAYFGCPYHSYCSTWSNPIGRACPPDMTVEFWDPSDYAEAKATVSGTNISKKEN